MKRQVVMVALVAAAAGWVDATPAAEFVEGAPVKPVVETAQRATVKTVKVVVPNVQGERSDTPVFRGEALFQQHCSVCHLGRYEKSGQVAPVHSLEGVLTNATKEREAAVRSQIQRGSYNMPSFKHTFTPREFEQLITFLKTR